MKYEIEQLTQDEPHMHRLNVMPSDENGYFIFSHKDHGIRAVGKISVAGISQNALKAIEEGRKAVAGNIFTQDIDNKIGVVSGLGLVAIIPVQGALDFYPQPMSVSFTEFTEVIPANLGVEAERA